MIVISTPNHRDCFEKALRNEGMRVAEVELSGHLQFVDAATMLSRLMLNGMPDAGLFRSEVQPLIQAARARKGKMRVFGEMVSLLWKSNSAAAIYLEELWNELIKEYKIPKLCTYGLLGPAEKIAQAVLDLHTHELCLSA